ncbi:transferase [Streptomyces sp. NPDC001494]
MTTETGAGARANCVVDAEGRIALELPTAAMAATAGAAETVGAAETAATAGAAETAARPHLLLRLRPKKGEPVTVRRTVPLEAAGDGPARAVLEPLPALEEGRWDVFLQAGPDDTAPVRLRQGLRDLRALVDGQLRDRPSPVAVRIPYATKEGYLAVRAWLRTAHAETARIEVGDRSTTVTARLHGATFEDGAVVRLRMRGSDTPGCDVRPVTDGDRRGFRFTVDHEELVAGTPAEGGVWDVFVHPAADASPVRVARLLDDVADRKASFVHPTARAAGAVLRPYYTLDNDLSIRVARG